MLYSFNPLKHVGRSVNKCTMYVCVDKYCNTKYMYVLLYVMNLLCYFMREPSGAAYLLLPGYICTIFKHIRMRTWCVTLLGFYYNHFSTHIVYEYMYACVSFPYVPFYDYPHKMDKYR